MTGPGVMEALHIGFPKTATTTLQVHVFANHPEIVNVARPFGDQRHERLWTSLAVDDDMDYPEQELARLVEDYRAGNDRLLLYSDETVVNTAIRSISAKRLARLFPDATVVAVVRNQFEALRSYYMGLGWALGPAPEPYQGNYVTFENFLEFGFAHPGRSPYFKTIRYGEILDQYAALFGRERISVLLFEDFVNDPAAFVARLAAILEIDGDEACRRLGAGHENPGAEEFDIWYRKLRTRFLRGVPVSKFLPGSQYLKRTMKRIRGRRDPDAVLTDEWRQRIAETYAPGNRNLAESFGLALVDHGYPL